MRVIYLGTNLNLWKVAPLIYSELGPGEHFFQTVQHIWPEAVLLHGTAVIVDLIEDVDNPAAEKDRGIVKVVHEAVKDKPKLSHTEWTMFLQRGSEIHYFFPCL